MLKTLLGSLGGLLGGIWGYVAAAGAAILGILAVYGSGKKAGKTEVEAAGLKKEVENVKTAQEVEQKVAVTKPDAVADELRNKWSRD